MQKTSASHFFCLFLNFGDHTAADHDIFIVEDHGLAHGEGTDGLVEADLHPAVREDGGGEGGLLGLVAVLCFASDGLGGGSMADQLKWSATRREENSSSLLPRTTRFASISFAST